MRSEWAGRRLDSLPWTVNSSLGASSITIMLLAIKHRDLLRLVVLLAVVRSLVLVAGAGSVVRPPPPARARHVSALGAGDLETFSSDPPDRP